MLLSFMHPRGVRPECPDRNGKGKGDFNSRTRKGCDVDFPGSSCSNHAFQLTHPRGVRLVSAQFCPKQIRISTHAPTRGATIGLIFYTHYLQFQLTHPRGVRQQKQTKFFRNFRLFSRNLQNKSAYNSGLSMLATIILFFNIFFSANHLVIICVLRVRTINYTIICIPSFSISYLLVTSSVWKRR